jgi:Phage integrase, N-terminal SAM-like domain
VKGNITRRGERSWRLKYDLGRDATGKRLTRLVTVHGTKKQAEAELTRQLAALDAGTLVEPSKSTVESYLRSWIDTAETLAVSPKTAERYRQLIEQQIIPRLGAHPLQRLRASHVAKPDHHHVHLRALVRAQRRSRCRGDGRGHGSEGKVSAGYQSGTNLTKNGAFDACSFRAGHPR